MSSGCANPITKSITITTTIPIVSAIAGPTCIENGYSYTYSVSPVAGATYYNWMPPGNGVVTSGQGTNVIYITYPSNFETISCTNNLCDSLRLTVQFGCGSSNKAKKIGMVVYKPIVTGPTAACYPDTIQLNTTSTFRAVGYLWQSPIGTQTIGSNSNSSLLSKINTTFLGGNYSVQSINQCGTSPMAYYTVNKVCNSRMADTVDYFQNYFDYPLDFVIFPNPNSGVLNFQVFRGPDEIYLVEITDQLGNVVFKDIKKSKDILNLKLLNTGIYFITVYDSNKRQMTKNFLKID